MGLKKNDRPVTEVDEEQVRELHAQGYGRNEIARRLGRGPRTVSIIAARLNLSFDRTATEEATRARMADLAEKRAILADALLDDALRLSEQVWEPATIHSFGGKDHTYNSRDLDEPLAADKRALMAAATAAAAQSIRLVPPAADSGAEDAVSLVGQLGAGLAQIAERLRAEGTGDEEAEGGSAP